MKAIVLSSSDLLSQGQCRACYVHPQDPALCIKIPIKQQFSALKKKTLGNLFRKILLPSVGLANPNAKEYGYYSELLREQPGFSKYMAHISGFVETSLGKGLLCELICDDTGEASLTLEKTIEAQGRFSQSELEEIFEPFFDYLLAEDIRLFDLNLGNIVIRRSEKEDWQLKVIDVKGANDSKSILPLECYIARFAKKKMRRRIDRLRKRIVAVS